MENIIEIIADAIENTKFADKAYVVGGFVRDKVMGKISNDMDIVVEMKDGGIKLANYLYKKNISTKPVVFPRFSTAVINIGGHKIEFVMTRKEFYKEKSRKPEVDHGTIKEDIIRRDFTINTLLLNVSTGKILDLTGQARKDIVNKVVRATSDPDEIFAEDPLRMLRAVRFAVQLDFRIDSKTAKGIESNSETLINISRERQRDELENILLSPDPARGVELMFKFNLMEIVIPELRKSEVIIQLLNALEKSPKKFSVRMVILLCEIDLVNIEKILRRLKFSNKQIREVIELHKNFKEISLKINQNHDFTNAELRKIIYENDGYIDLILDVLSAFYQAHIYYMQYANKLEKLKTRIKALKKELQDLNFPVDGEDIMGEFELVEGPQVGELLEKAKNIWYKNPLLDKNEILSKLQTK